MTEKFWDDPEFESWVTAELLKSTGAAPISDRLTAYTPKYEPPPPARSADSLTALQDEAAYSPAMMAPYSAVTDRRFRTGQYGAKFKAGDRPPISDAPVSQADPRLLEALRTPETERLYSPAPAALTERELSFQEYMSARSTKPDQREDGSRLVPYDFGIGDIFKIQMDWQIENVAIANTILRGEVNPFIGAGRLLNSWWKHAKQLFVTPEGQDERVWINIDDPETGQTTVVPADIRKRPPLGRLLSSPWQWPKGKWGQLRQDSPGVDVFAHGLDGLISVGKLGFNFSPYGLIARLVGMNVRNPFAAPVEKEPVNFWDYFPISMYWNDRVLERLDDVKDVWGSGIEFMQDYFEKNPPVLTANNTFAIYPISAGHELSGMNIDLLPKNLQKSYDEYTDEEKSEFVDYFFASQRIVSVPEYGFYFDKLKELNPDWDSNKLRQEAARAAWKIVDVEELIPLHDDVSEGFGDLMGAVYYYALSTGAFMDPEKHPWFNQEAFAAESWEKAVTEYAQEGNQLFIQGLKKIGGVVVEVDPDFSYTWMLDKEAEDEYKQARDLVTDQLGRDLGYWEAFRLKERYEDPVIEMIGEAAFDIMNLRMFNVIFEQGMKGAWRLLRATGAKALDLSYKVPVLGSSIRWLTRETTVSLSRRVGFRASEFFATVMQSARDNRSFIGLIDEFAQGRGAPISVGSRQLRYADELAQLARPEEWARMADNAVERATRETQRMAMANGITDVRVLDKLTPEPRLVVEELASTFEAIFINNAKAKYGDRLVTKGTVVLGNVYDWLRRSWIEQVLSARPGFTAINFMDSGFRHILYGAAPLQNIDDIMRRTPIPREIYMRFPVTEAGAALPLGQAPKYGPLTYFFGEIGTSTIADLPWPLGKRPFWTRSAKVVETLTENHPTLAKAMRVWNWGNFGSSMKQYNAWFEFAMSVRLYDSLYWRTFLPLDAKIGERLIVQLLGDASPDTIRRARSIWRQAEANPAKLQQLIADAVYGKGAGRGRPTFSFLIPDEVNSWLRGMPAETQQTFINNAVERIRPVLREADWTPERLQSVFDDLMDEYVQEWSAINRTMDADEAILSRGIIDPERAARASATRQVDDLGRQVEGAIDEARRMDATPQASHPIVDDILDANALPDGYTEPAVFARALNRGADPSPAQLEHVKQLMDEGVIVRDPDTGTVGLREDLVTEWSERKGIDKPKVTVPIDEEQAAAQADMITPEQQAAVEEFADEVDRKAKTLQDALEEARQERMTQDELNILNAGGPEADALKARIQAREAEAHRKARTLTARASDDQIFEAMNFENRERILAGERPVPVMSNGAQDYAAQEWLRRNPPPDAPIDPFIRPPDTDLPPRPDSMTPEGRRAILDQIDEELAALADRKGPEAAAAREAGVELRGTIADLHDELNKLRPGEDYPDYLWVWWDDTSQLRSRTQDFLRWQIVLKDQARGYFSGTKWGVYWRVQEEIYTAHKMLADEFIETIVSGEARYIERMTYLDWMDSIGFPIELDADGRLIAIHDATKIWRKKYPMEISNVLNEFEAYMMRDAPEGARWTDAFYGRTPPPKAAPGPAVPPVAPSGPVMGPTAPVKPIDMADDLSWSLGKVQIEDIRTTPKFQPRDTAGNVMQVDQARVNSIASQWNWKQYEPIKVNVVQPGEAALYGKGIKDGDLVMMGGHHRLGAAQIAGKTELPTLVYQLPYEEAQYLASIDNMIRAEQTAFEKGRVFATRIAAGDTETDLAKIVYNDPNKAGYVSRLASLTELSPDIARDVGRSSWFGESHGFAFADAVREFSINPEFQQQIFRLYLAEYQPSVAQFKQFLKTFGPRIERSVQLGLFTMDESWLSSFAKAQDEVKKLKGSAATAKRVINNPALADDLGVDLEQAQKVFDDLKAKEAELTRISGMDPAIPRTMQDVDVAAQELAKTDDVSRQLTEAGREDIAHYFEEGEATLEDVNEILAIQAKYSAKTYGVDPLVVIDDLEAGKEMWASYPYGGEASDLHSDILRWLNKNNPDLREAIKQEAKRAGTKGSDELTKLDIQMWTEWEKAHSVRTLEQEQQFSLAIQRHFAEGRNISAPMSADVQLGWARHELAKRDLARAIEANMAPSHIRDLEKNVKGASMRFSAAIKESELTRQGVRTALEPYIDRADIWADNVARGLLDPDLEVDALGRVAGEVGDAEKLRIEKAAEPVGAPPVEIEPAKGEIPTPREGAPSIAVTESVGQSRPHSAVPGPEGRPTSRRSPATHAGGGLAEGVRADSGIVTVSSELLPQPGGYVSAEYLDDAYRRTRSYFLKQGLGEEEAALKAFSFYEHQVDTANRAFTSFDSAKGYIIGDGTGTGKTFSAALITDQVIERGGTRHLLVAPNRQIVSQWEDVLKPLGIEVRQFATKNALPEAITTGERGVVYATTYSSMNHWAQKKTFSQMLSNQQLDLLIFDESHFLKNWYQEVNTAVAGVNLGEWADHTLYLSATPLESPLHAGYLMRDTNVFETFDDMLEFLGIQRVEREVTRYSAGGQPFQVYIETFDNVTPESLAMLNDELVREGRYIRHEQSFRNNFNSTTGEALYMYSASVPVPITQDTADIYSRFMQITDKFSVGRASAIIEAQRVGIGRAILENGKLDAAIELGTRKLADGNSVAFFVWRKQGSKFEQHLTDFMSGAKTYGKKSPMPGYYKALIESGVEVISPIDILKAQFPDAVVISGDVTGAKRIAAMEAFNSGKANVVIATIDAGGTGLSLHDVIGDYPRVQINLTVPYTALGVDQTAGRTFRMGSQSHGELYWLYADIALEEKYTKRTMKSMERMGALISGQDAKTMASDDEMLEFLFAIDDASTPSPYADIPTELLPSEAGFEIPLDRTMPPWKREGWEVQPAAGQMLPDESPGTVGLPSAQLVIDPKIGPETLQEARDLASFDLEAYAHIEELSVQLEDLAGKMEDLRLKGATSMEIQVVANDMNAITDEIAEVARAAEQPAPVDPNKISLDPSLRADMPEYSGQSISEKARIKKPMPIPGLEGKWTTTGTMGDKIHWVNQVVPADEWDGVLRSYLESVAAVDAGEIPRASYEGVEVSYRGKDYVLTGQHREILFEVVEDIKPDVPPPSVFDVPPEARAPGDPQPMIVATEAGPQVTMFNESIVAGEEFLVDEVHKQAFEQSAISRQWIAQFGDEARDHGTFLRLLEKDRDRIVQAITRGDLVKGADKPVQDLINEINSLAQQLKYNIGDTPDMFLGAGFIPIWMRPKGKVVQQVAAQGAVAELHAAMNAYDNWYRWLIDGGADDMFKAIPEEDAQKMIDWAKAALKAKTEVRDVARHGGELAGEVVEGALPETLKVMIDYATEYNIDSIAKKFFPFWKFPTRSIPFWIEAISTHPELLAFWMKYQNMSERFVYQRGAVDSEGRPLNRLRGYIPVPGTDNLWINPLGPLSAKVVLPMEYTVYGDPRDEMADLGPAEQTINIAYRWARQLGFNLAPWWETLIRKTGMVDRERFPSRSIVPALDLVPPWIQYDVLYHLRRLHLWPEDWEYLTPQVTWKDYLVERDMLAMQHDVMLEAPPEERAEIALATEQAILEREGNPIWDKAQKYTEETEYYNRLIGFFTGIYPKAYSDAEAALRELRHEINFLRDMIGDEVGAKIFDLPGEEAARRERWMERRYSVDEGLIYGLYSTISWTRTPTEGQLYGERRREYVEHDVLKQIQRRDYFAYNEVIYDELQTNLLSLPVGAPHELKEGYFDEFGGHKSWAETTDNYALARRTVTHPGPAKSESEWADWFADAWYGILLSTKPSWDRDSETYPEYKERVAQWERDLPMIAEQTLPHFQRDLTTLPPDAVWPDLLSISNKEAMNVWDLENDSALDALNRVWDDQYWTTFWETVEGKTGYDRDLAEMKFRMAWPAAPNEQTLLNWVEQVYGNKFSREELRKIINSGVMDVQGRLDATKSDQEKMADQVWLWMSWVGPNKKDLERAFWAYGGDPRDWDKWWSSEGDPLAWKEDEFEKFYSLITAAAGSLNLEQPTEEQLQEWSYVQDLHNTYKQLAKVNFGDNIFVISAQYNELPRAERADFRAAHPELEAFWDLREQYALDHPLWAKYYHPDAATGGGYSGAGGAGKPATGARAREPVIQTLPTLAHRSSTDVRDLLKRGVGRGRATRLVKWPVVLLKEVPDELVEEVEEAAKTGQPVSEAADEYLEYLKSKFPQEQSFIEQVQSLWTPITELRKQYEGGPQLQR